MDIRIIAMAGIMAASASVAGAATGNDPLRFDPKNIPAHR